MVSRPVVRHRPKRQPERLLAPRESRHLRSSTDEEPALPGSRRVAPVISLKARAIKLLAMREHSRLELSRKLGPHAHSEEELAGLLDELETAGHLSQKRFVESLVRRRAGGRGLGLIRQELARHGLEPDLSASALAQLSQSELQRAEDAWRKKFGQLPSDLSERARQQRFLTNRGFAPGIISALFRALREQASTPEN
jgi:regulatory protein